VYKKNTPPVRLRIGGDADAVLGAGVVD